MHDKLPKLLKEYFFLIIILAISILGIGILFSFEFLFHIDLKANEKISDSIYFLTGVILFWYTKETYDLKKNALRENWGLLNIEEESTYKNTNFAGLQMSPEGSKNKDINFRIFLRNIGQGALKITKTEIGSKSHTFEPGKNEKVETKVYPRGFDDWTKKELSVRDTIEMDYIFEISKDYHGVVSFDLDVYYQDILGEYKHKFHFSSDVDRRTLDMLDKGKLKIQSD